MTAAVDRDPIPPASARPAPRSSGYITALDGIRGVAVLLVFLFHVGSPLSTGGFLGVSVFFTLSGFLITRLLLQESARNRAIDLVGFWARRLRRLLPASLLAILLVLVLSATVFELDAAGLRGDVLAALGYVANWRFLFTDHSYLDLFSTPSPVLHYWSLAIEEQFYLLYPLLVWFIVRRTKTPDRTRRLLRTALFVLLAGSLAVTLIAARADNFDFVYYSLPTRAAELIIGALLATFLFVTRRVGARAGIGTTMLGFGALAAIIATCVVTERSSPWIGAGGLVGFSLLSAAVVFAALSRGPFAGLLSLWPLRQLGRISYGVYLFHWPVILWLTPARVGTSGVTLALLQAAVTLAIAIPSFVFIEQPIRRGRAVRGAAARIAVPAAMITMALLATLVTTTWTREPPIDLASAQERLAATDGSRTGPATDGSRAGPTTDVAEPPTVAFFGDSTALTTADGMLDWAIRTNRIGMLPGSTSLGCSITRGGFVRGESGATGTACGDWVPRWTAAIDAQDPDIVVVLTGPFDVSDRLLAGDTQWRAPGDPVYDEFLKGEMLAAADLLLESDATVVWLTSPHILRTQYPDDPGNDPARMDRYNEILRNVVKQRPGIHLIDLERFVERWRGGEYDPALRPDGVHFTRESANLYVAPWLGPELLDVPRRDDEPRSTSNKTSAASNTAASQPTK